MDGITHPPHPVNEPNLTYAPGSAEREALQAELQRQERRQVSLRAHIGSRRRLGGGAEIQVVQPHDHQHVLGTLKGATHRDAEAAIKAAGDAAPGWRALSFDDRAAIILKAADLLAGPWRQRLNAATMLGQSKTAFQAEIDSACELIDFWRFNTHYMRHIYTEQPLSPRGIWNYVEYRPLEGFVFAVTPFNFSSIGGNLPTAPALMGNVVLWKPASTSMLSNYYILRVLQEAGLPPGVVNFVPGSGGNRRGSPGFISTNSGRASKHEASFGGILVEHLDGVERVVRQILVDEIKLLQDVARDRDDVTADGVRLEDVEQFTRAGPDQLRVRLDRQQGNRFGHERHRIPARVGDPSGEHRHIRRGAALQDVHHVAHLVEGHDCRDVDAHARMRKAMNQIVGRFATRVGDGNLHVDVLAPRGDLASLPFHLSELVGEHFK